MMIRVELSVPAGSSHRFRYWTKIIPIPKWSPDFLAQLHIKKLKGYPGKEGAYIDIFAWKGDDGGSV